MPKKNTISTIFAQLSSLMYQDGDKAQKILTSLTTDQKRQLFLFQDKSGSTLLHKAVICYTNRWATQDPNSATQAETLLTFVTTLCSSCTYTDNTLADKDGRTPAMLAAGIPDIKLFQALSAHIDYRHSDYSGMSLFMHLLQHHNQSVLAFLLGNIKKDLRTKILQSPKDNLLLSSLAYRCPYETIVYLIEQGVPTGLNHDSQGNTALMLALQNYSAQDYAPLQDLLLPQIDDFGAHVNLQGRNLLHLAAKHGHVDLCQLLLDLDIPVDKPDYSGLHPIHCALSSKQLQTFQLLLDHLDNPHLTISCSGCPMSLYHYALQSNNLKAIEILLTKPVSPSAIKQQNSDGTIFHTVQPFIMALQTQNIVATRLFLRYGSNPNCSMTQPLADCPWQSTDEVPGTLSVSSTISEKNSPTYGEIQDWTPLHEAACGGNVAKYMLTDLLQHGALATIPCAGNGITPLMLAVAFSHDDITTLPTLLLEKSDLDARTYDGLTHALAGAISRDFYQVAGLLLDHGADPNLGCGTETPLSLAYRKKSPNVRFIAKLLRHGAGSSQLVVDAFPSSMLHYIRNLNTISSADLFTNLDIPVLQASVAQHFPTHYSKADIVLFLHALGEHAYQAQDLDLYRQSLLVYPPQIIAVPTHHILRNWNDLVSDYLLGFLSAHTYLPTSNRCDHDYYDPTFYQAANPIWSKLLPDPFSDHDLSLCKKPHAISSEQGLTIAVHSTLKNLVHQNQSEYTQTHPLSQPDHEDNSSFQQAFSSILACNEDPELVPALRYSTMIHYWVWWRTKIMMQPRASSSLLCHYAWNSLLTLTLDSAALVQSFVNMQLTEKNDTSWPEVDKALMHVLYRPDFFPDSATKASPDLAQTIWLNLYNLITEEFDLLCDSCERSDVLLLIGCFFQVIIHKAKHRDSQSLVYLRDTMQVLEDKKPELFDNPSLQRDFIIAFTAVVQTSDTLNHAQQQAVADLTLRTLSYPDQLTKLTPLQLDTLALLAKRYLAHKAHAIPHRSLSELLAFVHTHSRFLATDLTKRAHTHITHNLTSTHKQIGYLTHQLQALESTCCDQQKQLTAFEESHTTISRLQNELRQRECEATLLSEEHKQVLLANQKQLAKKQNSIDSLTKKHDDLRSQYQQAKNTIDLGNKKEQDLTHQVSELQLRINSISAQHDRAIQTLTEQLQQEREEKKRLQQDLALLHESHTSQETVSQPTLIVRSENNSVSPEKKSLYSTTEEEDPSSTPSSINESSLAMPNGLDYVIQTVGNYIARSQAEHAADLNHAHDQLRKRFLSKACRDFLSTPTIAQTQLYPLDFSYAPQTLREAKAPIMQFFSFLQQLSAYHIPYQSGLFGSQAFFWLLNTFSPQSPSFTHKGDIDLYIQVQPDDYDITYQIIGQLVNMVASVSSLTCQFSQDSCITRHSKLSCPRFSLDIHIKKATQLPARQRLHDFSIPYNTQKGLFNLPAQSLNPDKRRYLFGEPLEPTLDIFWPTLFRSLCAWVEHALPMTECLGQATPVTQTLHHAINQAVQDSTRRQIFVRDIVSLIERYMETDSAMSLWRLVTMDLSSTTSLAGCLLQELVPDSQPTTFSETLYFSEHITPMALLPRVKLATLITYLVRHKHPGHQELPKTHISLLSGPFTLFSQHKKPVAPLDDATWRIVNALVTDWHNHPATVYEPSNESSNGI